MRSSLVSLAIAFVLIAGLFTHAYLTMHSLQQQMHKSFDEAKQSGRLPPDADFDSGGHEMGMELPGSMIQHVSIADAWLSYWVIVAPLIIIISLIIPWLLNRRTPAA